MIITEIRIADPEDYRFSVGLEIQIDGQQTFRVHDGEPEDATIRRNFSDVLGILDMMRRAWEAGKNGEPFDFRRDHRVSGED